MTTECPSNYKTLWEITSTGSALSTIGIVYSLYDQESKYPLYIEAYGTLFLAVGLGSGWLEYTDNT